MKMIALSDVTMKQVGKAAGLSLSFKERIELAKLLDKLNVSVIELPAVKSAKIDCLLIKSVAMAVKNAVLAVPVALEEGGASAVWSALAGAARPRLQVCAPLSSVQMEYLCHKKPAALLAAITAVVTECRALCGDVEFVADDATRADPDFCAEAISTAIAAGAGTVTVCDTAGTMLPDEFSAFLAALYEKAPALRDVTLGVSCAGTLSMADSCAVAAIRAGAAEVKATACDAGLVSLPNVAAILAAKGEAMDVGTALRMTEMRRIVRQIVWMCQSGRSKNSPFDNGVQDAADEMTLTCHDDMSAVSGVAAKLGYELSEEDTVKVYEAFQRIAAKKEFVGSKELDAIIASAALQVPPTYKLESYVTNAGNIITATAHLRLRRDDKILESVAIGDGPVDASFLALEQIVGHHYELDDFQIQAVTEGHEAMGQTVVKLRSEGKLYSGRGISTDILGASVLAYINALNKIVYEEENA